MSEKIKETNYDLSFFLPGKLEDVQEVSHVISDRFKNDKGEVIPFIFKAITTERVDELEEACTIVMKNGKGKVVGSRVDNKRLMSRIAVESTVYPNFRAEEMRKAHGTEDAVEIARRVLSVAGEYSEWIVQATKVNGFDDTLEDLEEEAKN